MRISATALTAVVFGLAYVMDLLKPLGAHPWWSQDVILYGAVPGVVLALAVQWLTARPVAPGVTFGIAASLSFGIATWGKTRFAASYAEDALAGQAWFFGWIATVLFAAAAVYALIITISLVWRRRVASQGT